MLCQIQLPPCAVFRHKTMLLAEYHTQASLQGTLPDRKAAMYRRFARCTFRACIQRDRAAKDHHDVIMTPTSHMYFDYHQTRDVDNEPLGIGGYVPVEKVYSFEPVPAGLTVEEQKYIIGAQANLWTEYIPTSDHVEYMIMPRIAALSEVQWTMPEKKDYNLFLHQLENLMKLYKKSGYNY